ncbi:ras-domain-containing protein [Lentithecium fluviatile CBS 122367]|uniref:Ras-domain-containing protein n=1 Tax=Lentithecium fluviatile CBS 122367 TaxID=1168545 RepID=A0A6G1ISX9_9PLEO|nr:ras-domain-containing protein [Lentithecium fluviatile CBS 122367]
MGRPRKESNASSRSGEQPARELGSMYDYLAKVILLGPSAAGKSCLLHRFVKNEWKILSSQTIGVEFASKIVHINPRDPSRGSRKRIKLQLWDTAGTERFRSVSRSYYRGAAGAILVYDVSNYASFAQLRTFLDDARALASRDLTVILAGNKTDVAEGAGTGTGGGGTYGSYTSEDSTDGGFAPPTPTPSTHSSRSVSLGLTAATVAPEGREVPFDTASRWAGQNGIPVAVEVSALNGENVDELFNRLARMILTKIELGEIDPDDPSSGIQYGDIGGWGVEDGNGSIHSGVNGEGVRRRKKGKGTQRREWEEVFRLSGSGRRRGCC